MQPSSLELNHFPLAPVLGELNKISSGSRAQTQLVKCPETHLGWKELVWFKSSWARPTVQENTEALTVLKEEIFGPTFRDKQK